MPQKLSRRRYAEVVRFLKSTLEDERTPHKIRMQAAERLIDVYAAHDRAQERQEAREAKAEAYFKTTAQQSQEGAIKSSEEASEQAQADVVSAAFALAMEPQKGAVDATQ